MIRVVGIAAFAIVMAFMAHAYVVHDRFDEFFDGSVIGESRKENQMAIAGSPDRITTGDTFFDGVPQDLPEPDCSEIHWFELPFAIQMYSFCHNESGLLVHKYHWVSW